MIDRISEINRARSIEFDRSDGSDPDSFHAIWTESDLVSAPLKVKFENLSDMDGFPRSIELDRSILTDRSRIGSGCIPCNPDGFELVSTPLKVEFENLSMSNRSDFRDRSNLIDRF